MEEEAVRKRKMPQDTQTGFTPQFYLWLLWEVLSMARGNSHPDANNPFQYDWHHLRVAGLGVAAFLCVLGFIVLLSGKCKCRSKASHQRHPPEMSHLVGTGAVSTC
ncbi:FXYD domain-containing ion transport regulator 3 isoform X1 [Pipra filicauda]|uniref:FXYD domain-containing ion transport regulator n=1 Tax=Pipra filicauda TaxID=649802 RepID=A0A7R5KXY4_9PASS|nr:FXYD domain-containing ion transport regulator 3 isoform X1 [Pipra filicauda]